MNRCPYKIHFFSSILSIRVRVMGCVQSEVRDSHFTTATTDNTSRDPQQLVISGQD